MGSSKLVGRRGYIVDLGSSKSSVILWPYGLGLHKVVIGEAFASVVDAQNLLALGLSLLGSGGLSSVYIS